MDRKFGLAPQELQRLVVLNRKLRSMEVRLTSACNAIFADLGEKLASPDEAMADFEFDVEVQYFVGQDSPQWNEDEGGLLVSRTLVFSKTEGLLFLPEIGLGEVEALCAVDIGEPHCYLFHNLYDHNAFDGSRADVLKKCLDIQTVWADVVVRQQYCLDISD